VPVDAQVTYTPMRRPGYEAATAPAPAAPAAAPAYVAPLPAPVYVPPVAAPVYAPAPPAPTPPPVVPGFAGVPMLPAIGAKPAPVGSATAGTVAAAKAPGPIGGHRAFGLGFDAGMPDGLNLGLVLSPSDWLRLGASFGTNTASLGYRGGVSLVPVGWGPSFSFEAGHCNLAATNSVIRTFFSTPGWASSYVQQFGYTYFNAHLGFDLVIGNATFFLHGGYSYLMGTVRAPKSVVVDSNTNTTVSIPQDGKVYVSTLSAKLGVVFMF
jgi:hypothetical protein